MLNSCFCFYYLMYTLWIQQYMVIVKPSMSSLKIYTFWHQAIATPSTRLHDFFKNFVIMSGAKPFLKTFVCYALLVRPVFKFLRFYNSLSTSFRQFVKNLILVLTSYMFLWHRINRLLQFTLSLKFKPNSSHYTHEYSNILLFDT